MNVKDLEKSLKNKDKKRANKKHINANEKAIKGLSQAKKQNNKNVKNKYISIRVTEGVYNRIDAKRQSKDLKSTTEYIEYLLRKDGIKIND